MAGSSSSILGSAVAGPAAGAKLERIMHLVHFWISLAAFKPDTPIYQGAE